MHKFVYNCIPTKGVFKLGSNCHKKLDIQLERRVQKDRQFPLAFGEHPSYSSKYSNFYQILPGSEITVSINYIFYSFEWIDADKGLRKIER